MSGKKGKRRQDFNLANDLTVYDYADSSRPQACARIKKGMSCNVIREVKTLGATQSAQQLKEDLSWFEKDIEDFDVTLDKEKGEFEAEDEETQGATAAPTRRKGRISKQSAEQEKIGVTYPADLWYILADYIYPESVGRFGVLCKDAYATTKKRAFWRSLYNRYYSKEKDLPADLRPQAMERNHGLRARCIRALYFLSPVLVERVRLHGPFESDAHTLVGYRCLLAWHQPAQGKWHFCFKLQRLSPLYQPSTNRYTRCEDIRNGYNNIYYNPEEGCCVLQVTSTHFSSTSPAVMGQLLSGVHISLSHGFRHQRIRLSFDSSHVTAASLSSGHAVECVLDPVVAIKIFHWWDPSYPFPT